MFSVAFRKTQPIIPKSLEKQDVERHSQAIGQSLKHEHSGYRYARYTDLSCSEWKLVLDAIATFCTHSSEDGLFVGKLNLSYLQATD